MSYSLRILLLNLVNTDSNYHQLHYLLTHFLSKALGDLCLYFLLFLLSECIPSLAMLNEILSPLRKHLLFLLLGNLHFLHLNLGHVSEHVFSLFRAFHSRNVLLHDSEGGLSYSPTDSVHILEVIMSDFAISLTVLQEIFKF